MRLRRLDDGGRGGLARRLKDAANGKVTKPAQATLGALAEHYLRYKADGGKRSLKEDTRILTSTPRAQLAGSARRRKSSMRTRSAPGLISRALASWLALNRSPPAHTWWSLCR